MLAGFCAAVFIGDYFLAKRAALRDSAEFLIGVAGFGLAHFLWTVGQLRETRPDGRVFFAVALPLLLFVSARLGAPILKPAGQWAVGIYSVLTALSFATALASRRAIYFAGIGLLFFSDMMIGGGFLGATACNSLIRPTFLASEFLLLASLLWQGEWCFPCKFTGTRLWMIVGGVAAFTCFIVAAIRYPGGGYNPFRQVLSALGRSEVGKVGFPSCHWWFIAGMTLSAVTVAGVWTRLARITKGWRRHAFGWGGALNTAGLIALALVPENIEVDIHNIGCFIAVGGGVGILAARLRKGGDLVWACWLLSVVVFFCICLNVEAIPFDPWVTATQKVLILSFAVWTVWIAWRISPEVTSTSGTAWRPRPTQSSRRGPVRPKASPPSCSLSTSRCQRAGGSTEKRRCKPVQERKSLEMDQLRTWRLAGRTRK